MRCNLLFILLSSLLVCCGVSTLAIAEEAASMSATVRSLSERIAEQSPSQRGEVSYPSSPEMTDDIYYQANVEYRMAQEKNRVLLLIVIVASTPLLLLIVLICLHKKASCSGENIVNAVGLILVVEGTMFVAVSAVTSEQLTAPIGILGAIAGYLFGSTQRRNPKGSDRQST